MRAVHARVHDRPHLNSPPYCSPPSSPPPLRLSPLCPPSPPSLFVSSFPTQVEEAATALRPTLGLAKTPSKTPKRGKKVRRQALPACLPARPEPACLPTCPAPFGGQIGTAACLPPLPAQAQGFTGTEAKALSGPRTRDARYAIEIPVADVGATAMLELAIATLRYQAQPPRIRLSLLLRHLHRCQQYVALQPVEDMVHLRLHPTLPSSLPYPMPLPRHSPLPSLLPFSPLLFAARPSPLPPPLPPPSSEL